MALAATTCALVLDHDLLGLSIDTVDCGRVWHCMQTCLHVRLGANVVRALLGDGVGEVLGETVRRIVRDVRAR